MLTTAAVLLAVSSLAAAQSPTWPEGVEGTGTMGVTNPTKAVENTALNQTSEARLLTLNSVDDFCIFAPPEPNSAIADTETIEVAWCTKPRNNARLIPDGTLTGVTFIKNDFYTQIMGFGDFTKINIKAGDQGGELDPHGAYGAGNPIGGNVTTSVSGKGDLNVGEWMQFISSGEFCIRACTNANSTYPAATMCEHKLDEVGCRFVMPGDYNFAGKFQTCEADVAYPPGLYPTATANGQPQFSTFAQFFTGIYTANGTPVSYTVGTTVTPTGAFSTPDSRNCQTVSSVGNGASVSGGGAGSSGGSSSTGSGASASSGASQTGTSKAGQTTAASGGSSSGAGASSTSGSNGAKGIFPAAGALVGLTVASIMSVAAGAVMVL